MALTNCPECGSEISDQAFDCPNCGFHVKKPVRSIFGKIVKYTFIIFNLYMLYAVITGLGAASGTINSSATEAERAGATLGTGLGALFLFTLWAIGAFILGILTYFTRPKR